jgi:hypothetical protein
MPSLSSEIPAKRSHLCENTKLHSITVRTEAFYSLEECYECFPGGDGLCTGDACITPTVIYCFHIPLLVPLPASVHNDRIARFIPCMCIKDGFLEQRSRDS